MHWLRLIKLGDWLVILLAALLVGLSFPLFWQGGLADRAIIRQNGQVFAEVDLRSRRQLEVPGPLGRNRRAGHEETPRNRGGFRGGVYLGTG